jgi:hypothetical protein
MPIKPTPADPWSQAPPWRRARVRLTIPEQEALTIIAEHVTLPIDLLSRFLDRPLSQTQGLAAGLVLKRCLRHQRLLRDDFPWVWLSARGTRLAGAGQGRTPYPPSLATLAHRRAIAEVRLHLRSRATQGRWVSEREVRSRRDAADRIPDAVFEIEGERHAIEVELSPKDRRSLRAAIAENSDRYDAVVYFCGARTMGALTRLKEAEHWPKLIVRALPGAAPPPPARRRLRIPTRSPKPAETEILHLLLEQGAVPMDQFARFLDSTEFEAEQFAEQLCSANLTQSQRPLVGGPAWLSPTNAGARLAGGVLRPLRYRTGALARLRALNEVRLQIAERSPGARFVSRRLLLRRFGRYATLPGAVVEQGGERHAVQLALAPGDEDLLVPRIDLLHASHHAVMYFCANRRVRTFIEHLQRKHSWSSLVIRELPRPGVVASTAIRSEPSSSGH